MCSQYKLATLSSQTNRKTKSKITLQIIRYPHSHTHCFSQTYQQMQTMLPQVKIWIIQQIPFFFFSSLLSVCVSKWASLWPSVCFHCSFLPQWWILHRAGSEERKPKIVLTSNTDAAFTEQEGVVQNQNIVAKSFFKTVGPTQFDGVCVWH